ncbi:MAG: formylglycine-generating enzyme family protein [Anaerolineae bacterium]
MQKTLLSVLTGLLLLLYVAVAWAQATPPPPDSPLATPTISPTPEPLTPPGSMGEWWSLATQLLARFGPWAGVGLILVLGVLAFLWKVGGEVAGEEAKSLATRLRRGARTVWHRATRRLTPEERVIVKEIHTTCERLDLKGFVREQDTIIIVSLESIYVPLMARGDRTAIGLPGGLKADMPLLRADEGGGETPLTDLIAPHRCLVLVGEAGSGKTTFLKYVAYTAAQTCAGHRPAGTDWLPDPLPLPIFLPLHGLGLYLQDQAQANRESPSPDLLRDYIVYHLRHLDLPDGWLAERIKDEGVLLLLDGLDEVSRFEDRRFIVEMVTRFAAFYGRCRVVVTTRPQGYEGAAQLGGDFQRRDINPLRWPDDIRLFLHRWNEAIKRRAEGGTLSAAGRRQAREDAQKLMVRLEDAPHVRELANNPLLLTVMAIVHYNVGELPQRRADLYDAATLLLLGWDKRMGREGLAPPPWLDKLSAPQRRLPLEELALCFQERRVMERSREETLTFLASRFKAGRGDEAEQAARAKAEEYLTWVTARTYVLQEIGGAIRFYRKPFQEYLAARELTRAEALRDRFRRILQEDWRDRWWDETLLLTVGQLISDDPGKADRLLDPIRRLESPPQAPHYHVTFVARALADVPEGMLGHVWQVKESVVESLARAVAAEEEAFAPLARLEAGLALGALGDPRPGVGVRDGLPDILWVQIPTGPFLMGSSDEEVERWQEWYRQRIGEMKDQAEEVTLVLLNLYLAWLEAERGQHSPQTDAFLIARYPVTNGQYRCFIEAKGYDDPAWWGGEDSPGWAWRTGEPRWDWQRTDRPDFWYEPRLNGDTQPVVGVTWYEAMAFCRWLEAQLQTTKDEWRIWREGHLETRDRPASFTLRLPSEAEWEKAVRGTDGRRYPWGNEWEAGRANTREMELGRTSPVGVLPAGDGPYGLADGVGNVWEWTLSLWGTDWRRAAFGYPYRPDDGREDTAPGDEMLRVLRGGSWGGDRGVVRCASRDWCSPYLSDDGYGFRCVSPVSLF